MEQKTKIVGIVSSTKNAGRKDIRNILEAQEYRCALTGEELNPDHASLDHIVPVSQGGGHDKHNLQILTSQVNAMKGVMSNEEFIAVCRRVTAWNA